MILMQTWHYALIVLGVAFLGAAALFIWIVNTPVQSRDEEEGKDIYW